MLTIAIGTTSKQKLDYLQEILKEFKIEANLIPCEVKSLVSNQPLTSEETKLGSINRARHAFELIKETGESVDFSIGIEVGYEKNNDDKYEIFCWTSVVDGRNNVISGRSSNFLMPSFFQDILKNNDYVGDYLEDYMETHDETVEKLVAQAIKGRKPFIMDATRKALIYHFLKHEF